MNALEMINLSVRLYAVQRDLVERAAALVEGRTTSDYIREVLPLQAAIDLNEELPELPPITRGHAGSLAAQAAAKLGMTTEDFKNAAIRQAAAQALGANAVDARLPSRMPTPPSPRKPSGTYQQTHASPRGKRAG